MATGQPQDNWSKFAIVVALATVLQGVQAVHLKVCATPEAGFWMLDADSQENQAVFPGYTVTAEHSLLSQLIPAKGWTDRKRNPTFKGPVAENNLYRYRGKDVKLSGFAADLLTKVMLNIGEGVVWTYDVTFYKTYTEALYATTGGGTDGHQECDMAFSPFTVSGARTNCFATQLSNGVAPCIALGNGEAPVNKNACCTLFGSHMMVTTIGVMVSEEKTKAPTSIFSISIKETRKLIDVVVIMACIIIVFAHIAWVTEKTSPSTNNFHPDYIPGTFEAIWWMLATVTTVGYGDVAPRTFAGRSCAIIAILIGLVIFAMFVGTVTAFITLAQEASAEYLYSSLDELPADYRVCVPSPNYPKEFPVIGAFEYYVPEDHSLGTCVQHFLDGECDAVAYDEPALRYKFANEHPKADMRVLPGSIGIVLAPGWPARAANPWRSAVEQSLIVTKGDHADYETLNDRYFPPKVIKSEMEQTYALDWNALLPITILFCINVAYVMSFCFANFMRGVRNGDACGMKHYYNMIRNALRVAKLKKIAGGQITPTATALDMALPPGIVALFKAIDTDGSGYLEMGELDVLMDKLMSDGQVPARELEQIKKLLLNIFEHDVDGKISLQEFGDAYTSTMISSSAHTAVEHLMTADGPQSKVVPIQSVPAEPKQITTEDLRKEFLDFDADESGFIDHAELPLLMQRIVRDHPEALGFTTIDQLQQQTTSMFDTDGDNLIDFDEFVHFFNKVLKNSRQTGTYIRLSAVQPAPHTPTLVLPPALTAMCEKLDTLDAELDLMYDGSRSEAK